LKPSRKFSAQRLATTFAALLLVASSGESAARGQTDQAGHGVQVAAEVTSCKGALAAAVQHILGLELGELLVSSDAAPRPVSDRLSIRCAGNMAWLEASGADGVHPVDRTLSLDDFPEDLAPRALALAGLELLAARSPAVRVQLDAKREPAPKPASTPVVAPPPSAAATSSAPPRRALRLGLNGTWRTFLVDRGISAWGGQALVTQDLGRWWQLRADLEVVGSGRQVSLGETRALLGSCSVGLAARAGHPDMGVALGLGARVGLARLVGSATDQTIASTGTATGPWGGPMASASAHVGLGPAVLVLAFEVGSSLGTVRGLAEGHRALVIQDTWLAFSLGGALRK
jgi:hypothetical protein